MLMADLCLCFTYASPSQERPNAESQNFHFTVNSYGQFHLTQWRPSMSVRNLRTATRRLIIAASVSFILPLCCLAGCEILLNLPLGGQGTIYSKNYDETKFAGLRAGMTAEEVEAIMGPPLRKIPMEHTTGSKDDEQWFYSDQPEATADFWRRWVSFHAGKVTNIISDYWYD